VVVASNYEAICEENRESYGTKGAQKSGQLAAGLYDDRTHFIFELLQNAEDALGRRGEWHGSRKVAFILNPTRLMLSHFGKPFDEADVRSVCDIAESTKNESSSAVSASASSPSTQSPIFRRFTLATRTSP
jgi:hypothetical protein